MQYRRIAQLRSADDLRSQLQTLGVDLPFDDQLLSSAESPLAQPIMVHGLTIGNRFAVLPMEGWDGTLDGHPTDRIRRRWSRFGQSGAKLIWGGEAVAVRHDGRASPNQLVINEQTVGEIADLRESLVAAHRERFGAAEDLIIGLQLTHSGRFARPNEKTRLESKI